MNKKLIIAFTLTFSIFATFAQKIQVNKTYGGFTWDGSVSILKTNDGNILLGGYTSSGIPANDMWIVKVNKNGDTLKTKRFGGTQSDGIYEVKQTYDNGFIMGGYTKSYTNGDYDAFIVKADSNMNQTWKKNYGSTSRDEIRSIIVLKDSNYLASGMYENKTVGYTVSCKAWLLKLNKNGDTIWTQKIGDASKQSWINKVNTLKNGNIILGGMFVINGINKICIQIDKNGNIINTLSSEKGIVKDIEIINDSLYYLAGANYNNIFVTKTNSLLHNIWTIDVLDTINNGYTDGVSIINTEDNGFIVSGKTNYGSNQTDGWIAKYDSLGNKKWEKSINNENDVDFISESTYLGNNQYAFAGGSYSSSAQMNMWLLIVEDSLNSSVSIQNNNLYNDNITIYPNPTNNYLKIGNLQNVICVDIYNSQMQIVKTINSIKEKELLEIDFSAYISGFYYVEIIFENNSRKTFKIIKL